jgi:ubiquinone/menaquinone biosynthesis C-methylase UbiE
MPDDDKQYNQYWQKKILGIEIFKIKYFTKWFLYKFLGIKLPKMKSQRHYWSTRGRVYMEEVIDTNFLDREAFFQDIFVDYLKTVSFNSLFEAGCGFGWNIKRVKDEFSHVQIGGVDFSIPQLQNSRAYMPDYNPLLTCGDCTSMPLKDNAYDVGITVGVFMNIHPDQIMNALGEMVRVCGKYVIHLEYDENNTTKELKEARSFKTNIVSHDYKAMYESLGKEVLVFQTYKDFTEQFQEFISSVDSNVTTWEDFEGPEKYIFMVVKV